MHKKRLLRHLQGTVWPHRNNSWHPYLLRAPALATITVSMAVMVVGLNITNGSQNVLGVSENIMESDILNATNEARSDAGMDPLRVSEGLNRAAAAKAESMLAGNYWDHYGPNGETPWQFMKSNGYNYSSAGENLARGFQTSNGVVEGWMNSSGHRENLLSQEFKETGVAVVDGKLNGKRTTVVVAFYARPVLYTGTTSGLQELGSGEVLPAQTSYSVLNPINIFATMPLTSRVIGLTLFSLGVLYVVQHVVIRDQHLLWDRHIHPYPMLQAALLFGFTIMLVQASFGAVG